MQRDLGQLKAQWGQSNARAYTLLKYAYSNLNKEAALYGVEKITEVGTEMFLTNQAISGFGHLIGNGARALDDIIQAGNGIDKFNNLPLNGQTLQAFIGYEAVLAEGRAAVAQAIGVAGAVAEETLDGASKVLPAVFAMNNGGPGGNDPKNLVSAGKIQKYLKHPYQAKYKVNIKSVERIAKKVARLDFNKRRHILQVKHAWDRLVVDPNDWDAVARIITKVMKEGRVEKKFNHFIKYAEIFGERVEVQYIVKHNKTMISDAWIRTI
ncbi:MAG: polymorphic toxin type 35 domain-containing protein [Candidatus Babeliales bacterium]